MNLPSSRVAFERRRRGEEEEEEKKARERERERERETLGLRPQAPQSLVTYFSELNPLTDKIIQPRISHEVSVCVSVRESVWRKKSEPTSDLEGGETALCL